MAERSAPSADWAWPAVRPSVSVAVSEVRRTAPRARFASRWSWISSRMAALCFSCCSVRALIASKAAFSAAEPAGASAAAAWSPATSSLKRRAASAERSIAWRRPSARWRPTCSRSNVRRRWASRSFEPTSRSTFRWSSSAIDHPSKRQHAGEVVQLLGLRLRLAEQLPDDEEQALRGRHGLHHLVADEQTRHPP
ncbi:hypothetical protein Maq22A_3p50180 (plasmid) [Methylobacterium aquaticum]|uniref:Uncharacterized protein n=1 Tax=Methylobacterium aquaticum TaxID=270351 RepID=A0A0C6FT98_9HYPH|nr:hypothetical protein Maq22A_3p50180 [Methylobacterium aquaticum]